MSTGGYDVLLNAHSEKDVQKWATFGVVHDDETEIGPGRKVALATDGSLCLTVAAAPGYGKSFLGAVFGEGYGLEIDGVTLNPYKACVLAVHWSNELSFRCEYMSMAVPQQVPSLRQRLDEMGIQPGQFADVCCLCTETSREKRRAEYADLEKAGNVKIDYVDIKIGLSEIGFSDWELLMGITGEEQNSSYAEALNMILGENEDNLNVEVIRSAIESDPDLDDSDRRKARLRLRRMAQYVATDPEHRIANLVRPGRLICIDLRDARLRRSAAFALLQVLLSVLSGAKDDRGKFVSKLAIIDEVHQYRDQALLLRFEEGVRLMRKRGLSLIFQSQDPDTIPLKIIEMSRMIAAGRFTARGWYEHLKLGCFAFEAEGMRLDKLFNLQRGEFYVWALMATDKKFTDRPVKVTIRPSVTQPGGMTVTASGQAD